MFRLTGLWLVLVSLLLVIGERAADAQESSVAPWEKTGKGNSVLPRKGPQSARELLELFGWTDGELAPFANTDQLTPEVENGLLTLMFQLPKIKRDDIDTWSASDVSLEELSSEPDDRRFEFFQFSGNAESVERVAIEEESADRLGFAEYFRIHVAVGNPPQQAIVVTRQAPKSWQDLAETGGELNQPVEFKGMFLIDGDPVVFLANEVRWLPSEANEALGVSDDLVLLASLGMDIGRFDDINSLKLGAGDREAFYQLLAAAGNAKTAQLQKTADKDFALTSLLKSSDEQQGRLLLVTGEARQVTKVLVEEEDIRTRFGIDHYWQIDMFIPLPAGQKIRLDPNPDAPVYEREFPATLCVRDIPQDWKDGLGDEAASGAAVKERIAAPVFFYKLWAYRSEFVSQHGDRTHQVAPMMIGGMPTVIRDESKAGEWITIGGGVVFLLVIVGLWIAYWKYAQSDRKFEDETLSKHFEPEGGKSLNDMGIEASDGPDFSNLD